MKFVMTYDPAGDWWNLEVWEPAHEVPVFDINGSFDACMSWVARFAVGAFAAQADLIDTELDRGDWSGT